MSGFRKARAEQAALKMALYGPQGSGKTFTTLLLAEGLAKRENKRIAFVDTERGTDFYCQAVKERKIHPDAFDFDTIYTRSITEVLKEVNSLDTSVYGVIVIDTITHIWEAAKAAYDGKKTKIGSVPFQAWTSIKKPYKDIMRLLLSSPAHVFICGRQGTEYATDEETEELKAIGFKMKAEGETAYEPHILLRMEAIKPRRTNALATIVAYAEKDRTGILSGRSFPNPTFDTICAPLLGLLGKKQALIKSSDEVATDDAEAIEQAERALAAQSEELMRTFSARIELAGSAIELKKIGDAITPAIKAKMLPSDLAAIREKYQRRTATTMPEKVDPSTYWHRQRPPHGPETREIIARGEADSAKFGTFSDTTNSNPASLPPEAPDAISTSGGLAADPERQQKDAGAAHAPASDPKLERLKVEARAKAIEGPQHYVKWKNRLSAPEYDLVGPHLEAIVAEVAQA